MRLKGNFCKGWKKIPNKPRNINPVLRARITLEWFGGAVGGSENILHYGKVTDSDLEMIKWRGHFLEKGDLASDNFQKPRWWKNESDGNSNEGKSGKTWAEAIEHVQGDLQVPRKVGESAASLQAWRQWQQTLMEECQSELRCVKFSALFCWPSFFFLSLVFKHFFHSFLWNCHKVERLDRYQADSLDIPFCRWWGVFKHLPCLTIELYSLF